MLLVPMLKALLCVYVMMVIMATALYALILTNVLLKQITAERKHSAPTLMVHLHVPVITATPEMESHATTML